VVVDDQDSGPGHPGSLPAACPANHRASTV
jgi:hypothetical protein